MARDEPSLSRNAVSASPFPRLVQPARALFQHRSRSWKYYGSKMSQAGSFSSR